MAALRCAASLSMWIRACRVWNRVSNKFSNSWSRRRQHSASRFLHCAALLAHLLRVDAPGRTISAVPAVQLSTCTIASFFRCGCCRTLNPKPSLSVQVTDPKINRHIAIMLAMRHFPKHPRMKDLSACCWCGVRFADETRDQRTKHRNDCAEATMRMICSPETRTAATQLLDRLWSDLRVPAADKRELPDSPCKKPRDDHVTSFGFIGSPLSPPRDFMDVGSEYTSSPNSNLNPLFESFDSTDSRNSYMLDRFLTEDSE